MDILWQTVLVVTGLALLGYHVWLRLGLTPAARGWMAPSDEGRIRSLLLTLPGAGAGLVTGGLLKPAAEDHVAAQLIVLVALPTFLVLCLWSAVQVRVPLWWLPGWARGPVRERRARTRAAKKTVRSKRTRRRANP